jgi:AcrR family transcriptional regulator
MTTKKQRARTVEDKRKKKDLILKAARELFFKKGFYGTTIEMITSKAGVSTGIFYFYYKNKIEVFKALQDEGLDILLETIDTVVAGEDRNAREKLLRLAQLYLGYYREYREYFDIMSIICAAPDELKETDSELSTIIDDKTRIVLQKIEGIIEDGIQNGEFIRMDTWKAVTVFWAMMDGLILLDERDNIKNVIGVGLDELVEQALDMSFHGIVKGYYRCPPMPGGK